MQIHEITYSRVDEGILDRVNAGIQGAKAGYQQSQDNRQQASINKQTTQIADKAYRIWNNYTRQLEQFAASKGPEALKAFQDRSDGVYQKSLMAFVQKNLLQGNQIGKLINKDDIVRLVNQLSAPKLTAPQPPAQQGAQQPPAQQGAQQPPAQAQMPAGTPKQGAQQAAGAMKPNQARVQAAELEKTIAAQNQAKAAPPAQPGQAQPAQTQGRVPSTPAGANPAATVAPVPGKGPQANTPQKKKPVPAPGRTVQEAASLQNEKELFKQLVHATVLAMPDVTANKTTTKKDITGTDKLAVEPTSSAKPTPVAKPEPTDQDYESSIYVPLGRRIKVSVQSPGQNQPSFYFKNSDGVWTNELGTKVKTSSYPALEKYISDNGYKTENDPYYISPEEQAKTKGKRKK